MSSTDRLTERAVRAETALQTLAEAVDETARLKEQLAKSSHRVAELSDALEPFTGYDFHGAQYVDGLTHDGHRVRALHADDVDGLIRAVEVAKQALAAGSEITLSLAIKFGRISRHAGDLIATDDPRDRKYDEKALADLLGDPEVGTFVTKLERLSLLPAKKPPLR